MRHGHYKSNVKTDAEATLTAAGRQQATVLAQKIAETYKPDRVIRSDMTRAIETFDFVMKKLPSDTPTAVIPELKEGRPCQPIPALILKSLYLVTFEWEMVYGTDF